MKSRPRKISCPKRVEFLMDGPVYELLLKRLGSEQTVAEFMRRSVEYWIGVEGWKSSSESQKEDKHTWKTKSEMP